MCPDINAVPPGAVMEKSDINMLGGLSLAFIGDSVYDLMIRSYVLSKGDAKAEQLHRSAVKYANAEFQARAAEKLLPMLNEEEEAVYRRGRNAEVYTKAKNATITEYHQATGLEAVIGYLYLMGRYERLTELVHTGWEGLNKKED